MKYSSLFWKQQDEQVSVDNSLCLTRKRKCCLLEFKWHYGDNCICKKTFLSLSKWISFGRGQVLLAWAVNELDLFLVIQYSNIIKLKVLPGIKAFFCCFFFSFFTWKKQKRKKKPTKKIPQTYFAACFPPTFCFSLTWELDTNL